MDRLLALKKILLLNSVAGLMAIAAVPAAGDPPGRPAEADAWYMKTLVLVQDGEEIFQDDRSGVFGRIPGGVEGRDRHDIKAFQSVGDSPGAIVFIKSEADWGADAGEYLSDYRNAGTDKQTWTFTVFSSRPSATVTLYWETFYVISQDNGGWSTQADNANPTLAQLSLIDLTTGERMPASNKRGKMKSYSFSMDGATMRRFRWVQGKVNRGDRL